MFAPFEELPARSRVWIYQADRKMSTEEVSYVANELEGFCNQWNAHGQPLRTSFKVAHDQFVVLCVDEDFNLPSGCSIDSSVRVLKEIQKEIKIDFFDRSRIAFLANGSVVTYPAGRVKALFEEGVLSGSSVTFDNLVPSKGDFDHRWVVESKKTWLVKYLPKSTLAS